MIASQHAAHFSDSQNTLLLTNGHRTGIERGLLGEWVVAQELGVMWMAAHRQPGEDAGFDLLYRGAKIDVKTTKPGMPLMVPKTQSYKIPRVDALVLCWLEGDVGWMKGWISSEDFLLKSREEPRRFPIPTLFVEVADLREEIWL